MTREQKYTAVILKKQPYGEGDELITLYTREAGKIRGLAKSVKLPKSKLAYSLQVLYVVQVTLAGRGLPKFIAAESQRTFSRIRSSLAAATHAYYALELLVKFSPDEQKNEALFDFALEFFDFLDSVRQPAALVWGLAKFKTGFLDALGLSVHAELGPEPAAPGFSNSFGGFTEGRAPDFRPVSAETYRQFRSLEGMAFSILAQHPPAGSAEELNALLSGFLEYHLEREVKSEKFLQDDTMV